MPVKLAPVGEFVPTSDRAGAPCAACHIKRRGDSLAAKRFGVDGLLLMLCTDARACCRRYRQGLHPTGYAAMVRRGEKP